MKKKGFCLFLSAVLSILMAPVFAGAGNETVKSGLENIENGDMVRYGDADAFRVLDADQTNMGTDGMFLLLDSLKSEGSSSLGGIYFDDTKPYSSVWQGSSVEAWCGTFYGSFSGIEQGAVLSTTKQDAPYDKYGASSLEGAKVFFLSAEEADNDSYGFTDDASRAEINDKRVSKWWLRSPTHASAAGQISFSGNFSSARVQLQAGARPAFNLDLNSVLFVSAASGGKASGPLGAGALTAYSCSGASDWKLTLRDETRSGFSVVTEVVTGDTLTVGYDGAVSGDGEYISAVVTDADGTITHYGRIAKADPKGVVDVTLPAGFDRERDKLYLFNEQYHDDNRTDYAGDFREVSLTRNRFQVICHLTDLVTDAPETTHVGGTDYAAVFAVEEGIYRLPETIEVKIGGVALTDGYTWDPESGQLVIESASITGDIEIIAAAVENKKPMPEVSFEAADDRSGILTGVEALMEYSLDQGKTWIALKDSDLTEQTAKVTGVTAKDGIWVRNPGDGETCVTSDIQKIVVGQAEKPDEVTGKPCTQKEQNDGKITGVNDTMEYRKDGDTVWISVEKGRTEVTGLTAGGYLVRVKAEGDTLASLEAKVTVEKYTEATKPSDEPTKPSYEPTKPSDEPTKPSDKPTKPSENPKDPTKKPAEPGKTGTASPETGDLSDFTLWIVLLILSAGGIGASLIFKKRRTEK